MAKVTVEFEQPEPQEKCPPDFSQVVKMARSQFEATKKLEYDPKDIEHYIYEGVMEAVYGKEFWPWRNERINHQGR